MKALDILNAGNGDRRWNIFVVALLACSWFIGQYISVVQFETHVDDSLAAVTKDVEELKSEIKSLREHSREDTRHINGVRHNAHQRAYRPTDSCP